MRAINSYMLSAVYVVVITVSTLTATAQKAETGKPVAPVKLPGKGLKQFDFFYAGEAKSRNMYIVRNGKVNWSYIDTIGKGEISDAILLKNGNVLFAHQYGVTLINSEKKVLWQYKTPDGAETHTAQLIGKNHVVFVQNGNPAKVLVMNIKTDQVIKSFTLPFTSSTHGQIRHARLTREGTLLVAHMDLGKINEYDFNGKLLLSIDEPSVWSAVQLKNGNLLTASNQNIVKEMGRGGKVVWSYSLPEIPDYTITNPQIALRLPNGNTLINNWFNQWSSKLDMNNLPVQAIAVQPDKKIVWALRAWSAPDLGPSTTIQLLNDPENPYGNAHFGHIK
jgi:outer membrane protein assembly factor BamB